MATIKTVGWQLCKIDNDDIDNGNEDDDYGDHNDDDDDRLKVNLMIYAFPRRKDIRL